MKVFYLIAALFLVSFLKAQTDSQTKTTRAVVIGISDYLDPNIPDLQFAHRDALAFAAFLKTPNGGGLTDEHIRLLVNEQATASQLAAALFWLIEESKEGDDAIIYFSGHADAETTTQMRQGFLLTYDSPARVYLGGGAISIQNLQSMVAARGMNCSNRICAMARQW